jgi:hypothetical protein
MTAELVEALRERGLKITLAVRIADPGRTKIQVIRVVRELTRWGLGECKHAVDHCATIFTGVDLVQAETLAARLREAGASIDVGIDTPCFYEFDPADPRRGDQPLERLRVVDLGLTREHGRLGSWTPGHPVAFGVQELLATIDEQQQALARAGKRHATSELEVLEQLSAREPTLEDRLRRSDAEARRREAVVYGDWLQAQGDPRGLLASVAEDRVELERLVDEHASHLFGPSRELLRGAAWTWCGPVLDTLTLLPDVKHERPQPTCAQLAELLALPTCACLRVLALEQSIASDSALGEVLAAASCASGLRELRVDRADALALTGDSFELLERLTLRGRVTLGPAKLPALRRLVVGLEVPLAPLAASFTGLEAPSLEHFGITVRAHDYWDHNYGPMQTALFELLSQSSFARLRSLKVAAGPLFVGFADLLARLPAIATLERIDLRHAEMNQDCRAELARLRDRLPGLQI